MTVRAVEGKKPYTGGKAIEITEDKVINLKLRDENNLIIWDEGDNEIYVDLQLPDEIRPTDAFPVGVNTGRVIVDNGRDVTGTILVFKTTSGDNVKFLYGDDGKLYIDNGTGSFKQIYVKGEVDALLALKQDLLTAGDGINIDANNEISNTQPGALVSDTAPTDPSQGDMWYDTTSDELKTYDGTNWNTAGGGGGGSTTISITLVVNDWSNDEQTVTATGVTASNTVIVSPDPSSMSDYTSSGVYCSAQGTNSLTFTCSSTPSNAITVNVVILN